MPITFATPLLLAAIAAVAVPVLVHLIIREERSGQVFPSLMFIRRIPVAARRRKTLRDRALLALRCLAIVLLALAFAGPELPTQPRAAATSPVERDTILLLDRSYSMSDAQRWQAALAAAEARIEALRPGARMAIVAFDEAAALQTPLSAERSVLRAALSGVEPGEAATRPGPAFAMAGRLLAESGAPERQIVLISDLQRSALAGTDSLLIDDGVGLELVPAAPFSGANAAIMDAALAPAGVDNGRLLEIRVRNTGTLALRGVEVAVEIEAQPAHSERIDLGVDEERLLRLPVVLARDRARPARIRLGADALAADNTHHIVLMPEAPIEVGLITTPEKSGEDTLFLGHALAVASDPAIRTVPWAVSEGAPPPPASVLIGADGAFAHAATRRAIERFVSEGGGLLLYLSDTAADSSPASGSPAVPTGMGPLQTHEGAGATPVVTAGALDDLAGMLAGTRMLRSRRISDLDAETAGRVRVRLSDGAPWLVEHRYGLGRTLFMSTGLAGPWGNLALEPGFVPLLHRLVRDLAQRAPVAIAHVMGQPIDVTGQAAALPDGGWYRYLAADGHLVVELPQGGHQVMAPGASMLLARHSGLYEVHRADGRPPSLPLAVNPDRRESLLAAATPAEFQRHVTQSTAPPRSASRAETAKPRPLGWYLLAMAAALLWLESQLANSLTRRRQQGTAGTQPMTAGGG